MKSTERIYERNPRITFGRENADIEIADSAVLAMVDGEILHVYNQGSEGECRWNGQPITGKSSYQIREEDQFSVGGCEIVFLEDSLMIQAEPERIQIHVMELYPENYEFEGFPKYKRSPRIIKRLPKDTIDIQTPMEKSVMGKGSLVQMILPPLLMTAVTIISSLVMKMGGFVIVTALTTVLTTIFTVTKYFDDRKACRQKNKRREELYEDYLVTKRKELNHAREKEIEAWSYNYPQIDEMERLIREYSPRIYERNIHDEDFMTVAVGYWDAEVNFKIDYENNAMKYETDELEEEGEHLKEIFGKIPQKPMIVDLKKAHLGIVGDRENVHEQLQILLTQLVFAQSYHDLQIITIYDKEYEEEFSWMKWLPHSKIRALNLRGLINSEQMRDQVLGSILQILKDRKMKCEEKKNEARFAPYFLFVIDEPKLISSHAIMEYIDNNGSNLAFSVIYTTQQMANLPDSIGTVMEVLDSKKGQLVLNEKKFLNKNLELYRVGNVSLEWMARNLSVLQHEQGIVSKIPENITFYEMYGIQQARELNAEQRWKKSQSHKSLAVPLGVRGNDEYVYLNLHEKAHGPHGLVAGTTGSGKSEIIQSYILSLAVNFHPYEVGFLLIDYKGGGMAGLFKNLPHLLGTITNLDGAESLRAMASIKSELKRRQRIFSEYGVNHINGYNKLFKSGEASVPIPHLFLISDEFAELKKEQPDFMAELISTARIGRSLGVHLILATQKPSGVVDDQIWSNSKFKLALKVQDEADSREILKTADAAFITQPGRAYLQVGNNEIYELFQSAWSGATVEAGGMSEQIDDRVYKINELGQGELLNENLDDESESGEKRTQLEAVVDYIEEIFEEQHCEKVPKPWLPSLPFKMISTIQEIKAMEKLDLSFPLGMVDIPDQQSQEEFWIDLETEGNFGFFSAAGYGKSTVLTNCILSLARKNRVSELNFYIFDFGNSALIPLKKLAHTADYMTYDDEEKRGKFFRLIKKEMKVRKQKFAQVSAQSFSVYNQLTDKPLKAIVIVVDNMDILRELDSDEEEEFTKIARDGAGLGIYLMFSALSENGVRYGTLNNIKVKVAGYMYDAADISGIVGRGEYKLPDKKGRAMVNYKGINIMQLYTAVPFENEIDYIEQIQSVVEQINVYYPQEKAQSIPILPETLTYSMLEKGISNSATFHYNGNGTVTGDSDNGIYNGSTGVLNVTGGVDVTGMQKPGISNAGTATISGMARVRSASKTALSNGKTGTCTISGKAKFQYLGGAIGTVNNKSIYNEGRLINTSAATYLSSNNNSVLQNGTFEISSTANHPKDLCIYLYEQKFVTVTGTLNSVNYLQPKNRKAGRKVAQASYAGADGSTILNKLALTDESRFCLRSGKTLNLQKANAALKGSGINASDLTAKDVILSEAVQVTYKSGLNADIACTMPKTQDTYWYEDVKVKASVNVNGKESMKPYIQDKAQRNIYQFLGWYDKNGVQRYDPVTDQWYDPETRKWSKDYTYSGAKDLVLTARWEKSYNIAYHGNGQTVGDDYTQAKDKSLIISDTEMYKFDGKFYKGLVGEDTFQRTETYKKDENGNLLDKNNKTVTDERHAAKLTSLNPDTGKEEPCEEQYSVKEWGTSANALKKNAADETFELNTEYRTSAVYQSALNTTNDKGENLCITYDAPDDMVKKGREEKPADKLTLGVKKQDAAIYGASQGKMTSGTWLNMYAVWDKFPQLDAYNRYFTLKQAENGEITTEALLTTLRFKDEEDTDGRYLYSKDYEYNKKENCLIIKGKDGATLKLRAETDMDSLKETGKSTIRYTLTDSAGNITTKEVECRIVDTSDIQKEYDTYVRFISPKYYKKNGAYVSKENGGLEENSIWKTDPEYAALLDKAMSNEKRGIQKKSVRVFGVKFEADDPGSGTWDHVEETWEFTHEQVRSVDDFVDQHGYMNYKEKDGLKKFREQYKDCIK